MRLPDRLCNLICILPMTSQGGDILHQGLTKATAPFGLIALARLVSITAEPAARSRGIALEMAVLRGTPSPLIGDVAAIGTLVTALALSAIAAAPPGPLVLTLSVAPDPDAAVNSHGNTPATLRAEISGRFDGPEGFGLDLARRLVAASGARLTVETTQDGSQHGALALPVGLPPRMRDPEWLMRWARIRGGRLLVVDDSATNRMVTAGLLSKAGFSVELATGGAEAVVAVAQSAVPPEAVLMDVAMPDMDGIAATATIRSLSGDRGRIPIIAVTANTQPEDRSRCLSAGMNDYIAKPVRRTDLLAALERWLVPMR